MNTENFLSDLPTNAHTIYLDSSSLIRTYSGNTLSKNLSRTKYLSNPQRFSQVLNCFISPVRNVSMQLYYTLSQISNARNNFQIITCDCIFPALNPKCFYSLFGSLKFVDNTAFMNDSVVLYGDRISVETFFNASTLIRSADLIILDDYFLSLSVGIELLERKKDDTLVITLSSVIRQYPYHTVEIIDFFNSFPRDYHSQ